MKNVRLAIVGMGQRTMYHGLLPEVKRVKGLTITALCEIREDRLKKALEDYQRELGYEIKSFVGFGDLLSARLADAVYIATPNHTHRELTVQALAEGYDVLCEKPMATTVPDCDAMIQAARKYDRILALGMQMQYRKSYHKVMEMIDSGEIGEPTMLSCVEYRGPFIPMKDWVWKKELSGGAIVEKNCHHYGLLDWWAKGKPVKVYASGNQKKLTAVHGFKSEIVDNAYVLCDYDSGARSLVSICFLAASHYHFREFTVTGTEGHIWLNLRDGETLHFINTHKNIKQDFILKEVLRGGMLQDFADCVRERKPPLVTPEMGRASVLVPIAAERSMELGRPVQISEIETA